MAGGDALLGCCLARKQLLVKRFVHPLLCVPGTVRADPKDLLTCISHSSFMTTKKRKVKYQEGTNFLGNNLLWSPLSLSSAIL